MRIGLGHSCRIDWHKCGPKHLLTIVPIVGLKKFWSKVKSTVKIQRKCSKSTVKVSYSMARKIAHNHAHGRVQTFFYSSAYSTTEELENDSKRTVKFRKKGSQCTVKIQWKYSVISVELQGKYSKKYSESNKNSTLKITVTVKCSWRCSNCTVKVQWNFSVNQRLRYVCQLAIACRGVSEGRWQWVTVVNQISPCNIFGKWEATIWAPMRQRHMPSLNRP